MSDYQPQNYFCPECRKKLSTILKSQQRKKKRGVLNLNIKQKELIVMNVDLKFFCQRKFIVV